MMMTEEKRLTRKEWAAQRQARRVEDGRSNPEPPAFRPRIVVPAFFFMVVCSGFPNFWRQQMRPLQRNMLQYFQQEPVTVVANNNNLTHTGSFVATSPTDAVSEVPAAKEEEEEPEKAVVWLTSCETRKPGFMWKATAELLQQKSIQAQSRVEIRIVNICEGHPWLGLMTKLFCMEKFLEETFIIAPNGTANTDDDKGKQKKAYVLFSDDDVLLNAWAFPDAGSIMDRYHEIVDPGGHSLIIGAEPNCWFGKLCSENDFQLVYPDTMRTSCPAFVNSGLYMGEVEPILEMVKVTTGKVVNPRYDAIIGSINQEAHIKAINDQTRVSVWYSINRDKAILDREASLFRNLYFGMVNATEMKGRNSCGADGVASCGWFVPNIFGQVDKNTLEFIMDPVPGCATHPKPLFIHGNGGSKVNFGVLMRTQRRARVALGQR